MFTAVLAALLAASVSGAFAQGYPTKPIRWIVAFPPGGGADVLSRMLSPKISEALGQQMIIDNRGGAGGNIGAEIAAKSPPDGYAEPATIIQHIKAKVVAAAGMKVD